MGYHDGYDARGDVKKQEERLQELRLEEMRKHRDIARQRILKFLHVLCAAGLILITIHFLMMGE